MYNKSVQNIKIQFINTKYENTIHDLLNKAIGIISKLQTIVTIVIVISGICLILLNIKNIFKLIGNIGTILLSSSIAILIVIKLINSNINVSAIKLFNNVFSNSIVTILQDILSKINNFGLIILTISIVIILINAVICFIRTKDTEKDTAND